MITHELFTPSKKLTEPWAKKADLREFAYQEITLEQLKLRRSPVNIYLKSGIKIEGVITAFDAHVIILQKAQISQLIFKHAISTISVQRG